ncbi:antirestriction protein [Enterobacter kobei]|uniref:antirestriction protein n=1 Tax=Enterobacter kobei TaxID=208224 RepID=UPI00388FE9CF
MSADAAGITACLYLYSHLSFHTEGADREAVFQGCITACRIGEACEHDEKEAILAAMN